MKTKHVFITLQKAIEETHNIQTNLDVNAYLIDENTRNKIPNSKSELPEQFFIYESDEGMELALYIDKSMIESLLRDNPINYLHTGNIENFCIIVEGISHFVWVTYCAKIGRKISALELEIQAEVDKFIHAWQLLVVQGMAMDKSAKALKNILFEHYTIRNAVPKEEISRYHIATKTARNYCYQLIKKYSQDAHFKNIKKDIQKYFRYGLADKLYLT